MIRTTNQGQQEYGQLLQWRNKQFSATVALASVLGILIGGPVPGRAAATHAVAADVAGDPLPALLVVPGSNALNVSASPTTSLDGKATFHDSSSLSTRACYRITYP